MAPVFRAGDVPVYVEPAVNTPRAAPADGGRDERGDAGPEGVVESRVHDPVEIVSKNTDVAVLADRGIGDEIRRLAGCDDGLALRGGKHVRGQPEARDD